jgi:hypothetical protein
VRRCGLALWLLLALPPVAELLERRVLAQAALQIPGLALAGVWIGASLPARWRALGGWNANGLPGLICGGAVLSLWMLPRAMDASLAHAGIELTKYASLPLAAGVPLGLSWPRLGFVARAFVWANALSMLATLGWLYRAAPARLCSYYLLDDQRQLGDALLAACAGVGALGLWRVFVQRSRANTAELLGATVADAGSSQRRGHAAYALVRRGRWHGN